MDGQLRGSLLKQRADGIRNAAAATWRELEPLVADGAAALGPVTEADFRCRFALTIWPYQCNNY